MTINAPVRALALLLAAVMQWQTPASAQSDTAASPAKVAPPLTLENVLHLLPNVSRARLLKLLNERGVSFQATDQNIAQLQQAKAPRQVIETVRKLAVSVPPPPPPEPPKPKPTFSVRVTCSPPECELILNDKPVTTKDGEYKFEVSSPQPLAISAWREGYEISKDVINLAAAKPGDVTVKDFQLQPTEVRQAKWGDELLKSMLAKTHITPASAFRVSGVLTIKEAQTAQWDVVAHIAGPGVAELEMSDSHTHVSISCSEGRCQVSTKKGPFRASPFRGSKQEKLLQETFLLRHAERWLANEYSSLIARLSGTHVSATSKTDLEKASPATLQAGTPAGGYSIVLDEEKRPKSVTFAAMAGLTAPTLITYSDYKVANNVSYPALTEIKFSENEAKALTFASREFVAEGGNTAKNK